MKVHDNETELIVRVREIRPEPDGWGATVGLEVVKNLTDQPKSDYIRPAVGSVVDAFTADPEALDTLEKGSLVRARASLQGGPFGQRTVLRGVTRLEKPPHK